MVGNILSKQLNFDSLATGAQDFGRFLFKPVYITALEVGHIVKDGYATDVLFRITSESLKFIDLQAKTEAVARPMLATIHAARGFFDALRILQSINYIVNGSLFHDIKDNNVVPIITQAALALGRAIGTLHWLVEQKLTDFDDLARKAASIGGDCGVYLVNTLRATHLMNGAFLVGLTGLIYQDAEAINKGQGVVSHTLSAMSLATDIFSIVLGFANMANPHVVTTLAIVAASTGLAAWMTDPDNRPKEKAPAPIVNPGVLVAA